MEHQPLYPTLLDVPISYFEYDHQRGAFANVPAQTTTLRRMVSTKFYRPTIEAIRAEPEKTKQDELKKQLPAMTPAALLHHRKRDTSFAEKISQQWPLLMGDVDQKDNPGLDMGELKSHLARLPYVLLCAHSVRMGLWFVVRLPDHQTPQTLAAHFRHLQKLFKEKFGIVLDSTKGGNPTDLRFASYDAAPYLHDNATVMAGTYTPPRPRPTLARSFNTNRVKDEGQLLTRLVSLTQTATEGQRHAMLLKAATLAGGYVAGGQLDEQTAVEALETVASEWPTFTKSQKTIRDGIRYGQEKPIYAEARYENPYPVQPSAKTAAEPVSVLELDPDSIIPGIDYPIEWDTLPLKHLPPAARPMPDRSASISMRRAIEAAGHGKLLWQPVQERVQAFCELLEEVPP